MNNERRIDHKFVEKVNDQLHRTRLELLQKSRKIDDLQKKLKESATLLTKLEISALEQRQRKKE